MKSKIHNFIERVFQRAKRDITWIYENTVSTTNYIKKNGFKSKKNSIFTFNSYHIGDNLIHLNYLKKISSKNKDRKFYHYVKKSYIEFMEEYIFECENVKIIDINEKPYFAINSWKNYKKFWLKSADKFDFIKFHIDFFEQFSKRLNVENPFKKKEDFQFDSSCFIQKSINYKKYKIFIVNSTPLSGQFDFNEKQFNNIIKNLAKKYEVITTKKIEGIQSTVDFDMNLIEIAAQSIQCDYHIMVSTGPSWYVLNTENCSRSRGIILLASEEIISISDNCKTISSLNALEEYITNVLML